MSKLQETVQEALKKGHSLDILSPIKSGKEAEVLKAVLDGVAVALKVYKNPEHRTFRNARAYVAGKYYKKPSEKKAIHKNNAFGAKLLHTNWVHREFFLLQKFYTLGICVPQPLLLLEEAFCMEYLGGDYTAPRLCDIILSKEEYAYAFSRIMDTISTFWQEGIVHGDLSAFNILWHNDAPYIIDFPQAIDIRHHPQAEIFLERDISNVVRFFESKIVIETSSEQYVHAIIMGKY